MDRIYPEDFVTYDEYLDACMQSEIDAGVDPEKAKFDRMMYEANGEEWEGQYGGKDGMGPGC